MNRRNNSDITKKTQKEKYTNEKLKFYGSLIFLVLVVFLIWLIIITVEITKNKNDTTTLYINNGTNNTISSSNVEKKLYTYYTRNLSTVLKSYKGKFLVTYNPIGSVEFSVTNQTGKNITGNITNSKYENVPTVVEFNSTEPTGILILNYKTNINFTLERLEILIL